MSILRFNDGVNIDTSGPLPPVYDKEEALDLIAKITESKNAVRRNPG
jgi:hypothetical protein